MSDSWKGSFGFIGQACCRLREIDVYHGTLQAVPCGQRDLSEQ